MDTLNEQYGYDESIFTSEVPEYFHCVICTLVLKDPVQIISCGHKMCAVCFERVKAHSVTNTTELRCPFDRDLVDLSDVREDVCSKRVLGNMQVRCYEHERGCEWMGELRQLHTHADDCQFKPQEEPDPKAGLRSSEMMKEFSKRLEEFESSLLNKDKEIALLKQHVQEQQQFREEMEPLKAQVSQLAWKNMELDQRQQQQQQQQQLKNEMLEHQISELAQKNVELEQRLQLQQQQQETLQQQHGQYEKQQQQHEQEMNELCNKIAKQQQKHKQEIDELNNKVAKQQQQHKQEIDELNNRIETLQKGKAHVGNGGLNISVTPAVPLPGDVATQHLMKDQPAVVPKEEITVELHCGRPNDVTVSKGPHCVKSLKPVLMSTPRAVVPPGSKAWYEVKCTRPGPRSSINVGWATSELPFSKTEVWLGNDTHSYGFDPFGEWKKHKKITKWGMKLQGNSGFVGVALDLIEGKILFSVNGQWTAPMGVAFSGIPTDIKLFPAFNGGTNTSMEYNFGDRDFTFAPPDGTFVKLLDVI